MRPGWIAGYRVRPELAVMDYAIGLGSNLGSRRASLQAALALLDAVPATAGAAPALAGGASYARVLRVSPLYESDPVGPPQARYYNAAARVQSELPAHALLARLLAIEAQLGRKREPAQRWTARTIDLDILWAETGVTSNGLVIPHAHLRERWFALAPLLDVAPELAAEYGPALAALGGARAALAEPLAPNALGELRATPHGLQASGSASARDDALADALGALGRRLFPGCGADAVEPFAGRVAGDPLLAFARGALDHAARGFAFAHVTVCELGQDRFEGRLVGAVGQAPSAMPGLLAASDRACAGGRRVVLELGP